MKATEKILSPETGLCPPPILSVSFIGLKGRDARDRAAKNQGMHIMRAFIGVDRF